MRSVKPCKALVKADMGGCMELRYGETYYWDDVAREHPNMWLFMTNVDKSAGKHHLFRSEHGGIMLEFSVVANLDNVNVYNLLIVENHIDSENIKCLLI